MALDTLSKAIGDTIDLSVGDIIAKFGGDKRAIALAAQKGEIDPTKAVMAGMAVDRVVASAAQPQNTTVAEDALPGGLMAAQGFTDPTAQPQMGQPQAPQRPGQGLNQVPVPQRGFAGGGIVGFQAGGRSSLQDILKQMSMQELEYYNRTGRLPEKYRMMMPGAIVVLKFLHRHLPQNILKAASPSSLKSNNPTFCKATLRHGDWI